MLAAILAAILYGISGYGLANKGKGVAPYTLTVFV